MKNISTLFISILLFSGFYTLPAFGDNLPSFSFDDQLCETEDCYVTGYGESERAIWLPSLPGGIHEDFEFDENGGHFETFPDGTAHMWGTVVNMEDPNYAWEMDIWFTDRMDWDEWSDLGRGWKGNPDIVGNLYETWDYFIMDPDAENVLVGIGELEGSQLTLTHRPSSYHYGLQIGEAANDKNGEPGMSCWFDYSGQINGELEIGHGDANLEGGCENLPVIDCIADVELECGSDTDPQTTGEPQLNCPESFNLSHTDELSENECGFTIVRTWTATHVDTGEEVFCEQTITVTDTEAPQIDTDLIDNSGCSVDVEAIAAAVTDNCDENPTVEVEVVGSESVNEDLCEPGMFRTQTMGGWGAPPSGSNPGVYLDNNFEEAFPNGITIGCENTITFTSSQAVRDFLPSGSAPSVLPEGNMTDPGDSYSNNFAGQVLALSVSVGFDNAIEDFGDAPITISELEINSGPLAGITVAEVLEEANSVLGGCEGSYSITDLNSAITGINENYVDGDQNNGFLDCETNEEECIQSIEVQITASDNCGNTVDETISITISDNEPPVFVDPPEDITVDCGEVPDPVYEVEDNCTSAEVIVTVSDEQVSGACLNTIQRTFTATDACGNVTTHIQYIQQVDNEAPVFQSEPEDLSLFCGDEISDFEPVVTDNCAEDVAVEFSEEITQADCQEIIVQTWTALDACSNVSTVSRQVVITDNEGPELNGGSDNLSIECGELSEAPKLQFLDGCSGLASVIYEDSSEPLDCGELIVRSYTVTDNCGNTSTYTQNIEINDNTPPEFVFVPSDVETLCGATPELVHAEAVDNCSDVEVSFSESVSDEEGQCGQIVRTWTATDACGNSSVATQTVTQTDSEAPVFSNVPDDITLACGEDIEIIDPSISDNCDNSFEVEFEEVVENGECEVIITRTWIATDDCGNASSASQTITLQDNEAPFFDAPEELTVECAQIPTTADIGVFDDCSEALEVSFEDTSVDGVCDYSFVRTWTATDVCGNTATFDQTIHVVDNTPPEFVYVPQDMNVPCNTTPLLESPEVVDNCSDFDVEFEESAAGSGCQNSIIRTWTATDGCGNTSQATQTIDFIDNQGPQFDSVPEDVVLSCGEEIPAAPEMTATDNCTADPEVVFSENTTEECGATFTIERTWTATDDCGNSTVVTQLVEVVDDVAPEFEFIPEDVEVSCGTIPEMPEMTATDNCGGEVEISFESESPSGGCPNIQRIWTATDECGNQTVAIQLITITDNEAPVFLDFPEDMEVDCNSLPEIPEPDVVDNCDENVTVTVTQNIIGGGCEFTVVRTWIASDACGNSIVRSQSITVTDTEAPVFAEAPQDLVVECGSDLAPDYPEVVDDCAGTISVTHEDEITGSGCEYEIVRTFTATDECGNSATAEQSITVIDTTPPSVEGVPANVFVDCNNIPESAEVTATDACSGDVEVTLNEHIIGEGCEYIINREYYAVDDCGNATSITTLVHVSDESAPTFSGIEPEIFVDCDEEMPNLQDPEVSDNCSSDLDVNFTSFSEDVSCGGEIITRIWTATDDCGNTGSFTQVVNKTDMTAPVMTDVPANTVAQCGNLPPIEYPQATDNCSGEIEVNVTEEVIPGNCPYEVVRVFRAYDNCGNMSMATQTIYVHDDEAPALNGLPADTVVTCGNVPGPAEVSAHDNCSDVAVHLEETVENLSCGKEIYREWTATDACGNTTSHTQTITVEDNEAPEFEFQPGGVTVECAEIPSFDSIPVTDDCGEVDMTMEEFITETECSEEYELFRIWTASDGCGNQASIAQQINVVDNTAPVISDLPSDTVVSCNEVPEVPELVATDGCNGEGLDIVFEEQIQGETESDDCHLGNAVTLSNDVALLLPGVEGMSEYFIFGEEGGLLERNDDGTAHITGQVYDIQNANLSWVIDIHLENQMTWDEWSALGRSYKDDAGYAEDNYLDWEYYTVDETQSQLIGAGEFSGSTLSLSHAPLDFMYGFQIGLGANNRNAEFGMSGWFMYDGEVNGTQMSGMGDIIVENNCCPEHEILRTWTVTDCAGNTFNHTQFITVTNTFEAGEMIYPFYTDDATLNVTGSEGEMFELNYSVPESGNVNISLYDISGNHIKTLVDGSAKGNEEYTMKVNKTGLPSGIYLFRMIHGSGAISEKEIVER